MVWLSGEKGGVDGICEASGEFVICLDIYILLKINGTEVKANQNDTVVDIGATQLKSRSLRPRAAVFHAWNNWRDYLNLFAPLLFQGPAPQ
jgi:hypothetical protein